MMRKCHLSEVPLSVKHTACNALNLLSTVVASRPELPQCCLIPTPAMPPTSPTPLMGETATHATNT